MRNAIATVIVLTLSVLSGCQREDAVSVYSAPKEAVAQAQVIPAADKGAMPPGHPPIGGGATDGTNGPPPPVQRPAEVLPLTWTTPPSWKQLPGNDMRVASFQVSDDPKIQLSVSPLGQEAGQIIPNVNRWENQIGLQPTPADKIDTVAKKVSANGLDFTTVNLVGPESANPRMAMLAAMTNFAGQVWFFKLAGPADVVSKQAETFDTFIKSIKPNDAAAAPQQQAQAPMADPHGAAPGASLPAIPATGSLKLANYKAGSDWKETPGSKAPRMAAFTVGEGDKKADLIVTRFGAHNAGSFLENVNRWRGQIGLPPVPDMKEVPMTDAVAGKDPASGKENAGVLLTLDNASAGKKMLVVISTVGPDLWFFKLTGAPETVDKEKPAFDAFLKSLEFAPEPPATEEKP